MAEKMNDETTIGPDRFKEDFTIGPDRFKGGFTVGPDRFDDEYADHRLRMRDQEANLLAPEGYEYGEISPDAPGKYGKDIAKAIPHGFGEAVKNAFDAVAAISATLDLQGATTEDPFGYDPEKKKEYEAGSLTSPFEGLEPETLPGGLTSGAVQFMTGFLPFLRLFRLAGAPGYLGVVGAGMAADVTIFEAFMPNLANHIDQLPPELKHPVIEFLAKPFQIEEDATRAEATLKRAAEGLLFASVIDGFLKCLRVIRQSGIGPQIAKGLGKESVEQTGLSFLEHGAKAQEISAARGGATWDLRTKRNLSGEGKIVMSPFPERQRVFEGPITAEQVAAYAEMNKDLLLGGNPNIHLGIWPDPDTGRTFLDVVGTIPEEHIGVAHRLGKEFDQKAGFNLRTGEDIPFEGTGGGKSSAIPELERMGMVPPETTGKLKLQRYVGEEGLTELDPAARKQYTGVSARERGRLEGVLGEETVGAPERLNYYLEGATHEPQVVQGRYLYEAEVPKGRMYNALMDPLGLRAKATPEGMVRADANTFERLIKQAGFIGYTDPSANLAAVFEKLPAKQIKQKLPFIQAAKAILRGEGGFLDLKPGETLSAMRRRKIISEGSAHLAIGEREFNKFMRTAKELLGPDESMVLKEAIEKDFDSMLNTTPKWLTRTGRLMEYWEKGKYLSAWYNEVPAELEMAFGKDAKMFTKFLAATSSRTSSKANITLAMKAYSQWVKAGRAVDFYDFKGFVGAHRSNLRLAAGGFEMSGPKVLNFEKALSGDLDAVVIDRWMMRAYGVKGDAPTTKQYETLEALIRKHAAEAGVKPAEWQAGVWVGVKTLEGRPGDVVDSWKTLIADWLDANPLMVEELGLAYKPRQPGLGLLKGQAGLTRTDLARVLGRVAVGAIAGGVIGDTTEERIRNAAIGMGILGLTSPIVRRMSGLFRSSRAGIRGTAEEVAEGMATAKRAVGGPETKTWDELVRMHQVPDEVKGVWDEFNALVNTFEWRTTKAKRGDVRGRAMAHFEGELLGWNIGDVKKMVRTFNLSDEQASALVNVMKKAGDATIHAARKWVQTQAPEDMENFLRLYNTFLEVDPKRLAGKAEAGRSLGILNDPLAGYNKYLDQFAGTAEYGTHVGPNRLAQMVAELGDAEQLGRAFHRGMRPGVGDVLLEIWINGLLSGPTTHAVNFLGNSVVMFWAIPERAIASRLGKSVHKGEATAMWFGMMNSWIDAWKIAGKALRTGEPASGLTKIETRFRKSISAETFGTEGGIWASSLDFMGELIRSPGSRFLLAGDEFFKVLNSRMQTYALAWREGIGGDLKGKKFAEYIKTRLNDMPSAIKEGAEEFAAVQTFTNELGGFGQALSGLANSSGYARIIAPFVKTPINLFKWTGEHTPGINLIFKEFRADIKGGGVKRDMALAKMATGGMTMATFATLAASGFITGRKPENKVLADAWEADGKQEYSMYIPILKQWVSFARTDPVGMQMGLAADFVTICQQADAETYGEWAETVAAAGVAALSRNLASKTYAKGIADATEAITSEDPEKVRLWLKNFTGSFVPAIVATAAREVDPVRREARTITDKVLSRTPWLSKTIPARVNIFNEVQHYSGALGPDWISPFYSSAKKDPDPVMKEIAKNETEVMMPPWSINGVKLNGKQRNHWIALMNEITNEYGLTMKQQLQEVINSPEYKEATEGPDGMQSEIIKKVIYTYKNIAYLQLRKDDNELDHKLRKQEVEDLQARWGEKFNPDIYMEAIR